MNEFILECNIQTIKEGYTWDPSLHIKVTTLFNALEEKPFHIYFSQSAAYVYFKIDAQDNFVANVKANEILHKINSIAGFGNMFKIYRFSVDRKEMIRVRGM